MVIKMLKNMMEIGLVKSMIFITHELPLLYNVTDDIMVMYAGQIVERGTDSGSVYLGGVAVSGMSDRELTRYRRDHVGFVFQNFNLIAELTALENISLTADTRNDPDIAEHMLELVGLSEKRNNYPAQLSGGQQQRVSIARALAKNPALLLCDEPTGALDSETGRQILIQLEDLVRSWGKTVVIVTHTKEMSRMADRIVVLRNGSIIRDEMNGQVIPAREIEW
jgi:putative ABC transport system ATP-binding protein